MTVTYIKPKNNSRSKLIGFLSKHLRKYEQKISNVIAEEAAATEEVQDLLNNKTSIEERIGEAARVEDVVVNLAMLLRSAMKIHFCEISGEDLTQDLEIAFSQRLFKQNCSMYLTGGITNAFNNLEELSFINDLHRGKVADFVYKIQWSEGDGFKSVIKPPQIENANWLERLLIDIAPALQTSFADLTEYLEGRKL